MFKNRFRIGELANNLSVERFVIRFWEKEFGIKAKRTSGGQRFYNADDLKYFQAIKNLLYQKKFTIAGAKAVLKKNKKMKRDLDSIIASEVTTLDEEVKSQTLPSEITERLKNIREKLVELKKAL